MKKVQGSIVLLLILFFTTGCMSLNVSVDVLKPEVVEAKVEHDFIESHMLEILSTNDGTIDALYVDSFNQVTINVIEYTESKFPKDTSSQQDFQNTARDIFTPIFKGSYLINLKRLNKLAIRQYEKYKQETTQDTKQLARKRLVTTLKERIALGKAFTKAVETGLQQLGVSKQTPEGLKLLSDISESNTNIQKQIFVSHGFEKSKYTYYVVSEKEGWAKAFDKAYGNGQFGNTNVAIKAIGTGNFTVKGLTFNPADVANTASKVTTQSVMLAAQIAGVPISLSGEPQPTDDKLAVASSQLSDKISTLDAKNQQLKNYKSALLRIAQSILAEQSTLENASAGSTDLQSAVDAISSTYNSQKGRITFTSDRED